jgi:hypothetical protein
MKRKLANSKNKISGISYAFTDDGIELPVLDITHPLFISTIDENVFKALSLKAAHKAEQIKNLTFSITKIIAKLLQRENTYLSGMRTLTMKLGPNLLKGRKGEFWHKLGKLASKKLFVAMTIGLNTIAIRMRLRDVCKYQSEILIPQLKKNPRKNLCFINIAGGAASDTINTLILIQKKEPLLLKERKIEINILDIDTYGPNFAKQCIEALKEPNAYFHELDISFRHIQNNWNNTQNLLDLLSERKDWIQICASEGGLFEYGSDKEIIENLNIVYDNSADNMQIVGTLQLSKDTINPAFIEMSKITGLTTSFIGIEGLKGILKNTNWILDCITNDGTLYIIFTLKKEKYK